MPIEGFFSSCRKDERVQSLHVLEMLQTKTSRRIAHPRLAEEDWVVDIPQGILFEVDGEDDDVG